jgi:hypothetical protein
VADTHEFALKASYFVVGRTHTDACPCARYVVQTAVTDSAHSLHSGTASISKDNAARGFGG